MTFLAFRPFPRRKHRNDVIVTSYIKISQILKLKSNDITGKTLHAKFYASRIKASELGGGKIRRVWSVFKSPGKIGLSEIWRFHHKHSTSRDVTFTLFGIKFLEKSPRLDCVPLLFSKLLTENLVPGGKHPPILTGLTLFGLGEGVKMAPEGFC